LRSFTRLLIAIPVLCLAVSSTAFASGFSIFEQGAKATAMGGAFAATADDPSAIFYNPAGIAQQRHATVMVGGTIINFANEFRGDPNDPFTSGSKGQYKRHTFIPPNAYAIVPIGQNLTVGVGAFAAFGLRTSWEDPWIGRFVSRDADLRTKSIEPAIAWQTSDGRLAIGAGYEYRSSTVVLNRNSAALNPFNGRIVDAANAYLRSDSANDSGYNVGILFKPTAAWRFGASYRSEQTIDYKGSATFTQFPTGNAQLDAVIKSQLPPNQAITTSINFPSIAIAGVATTAIPNWDVEFDVSHYTWSRFKTLNIVFATTPAANLTRPQNWKDSSAYRLGANRRINDMWDVRFGAVYDKNPQPTSGVGPLLPDSDRVGASFGVGYRKGPLMIDLTDFVLHFKKRSTNGTNSDNFNGTYKTDANLISVDFGYRF
jgi:long-chain fatty acid transport protein